MIMVAAAVVVMVMEVKMKMKKGNSIKYISNWDLVHINNVNVWNIYCFLRQKIIFLMVTLLFVYIRVLNEA